MLLAIDIGNTRIKCGLFDKDTLESNYSFSSVSEIKFENFQFSEAAITSVVPFKTIEVVNIISKATDILPFVIDKNSKFNLQIDYNTPDTLGIDRICSCEGAYYLTNKKLGNNTYLVTIDFGTATTINVVKPPCNFIGGVIAPGVQTMFESLNSKTSQLPSLNSDSFKSFLGNDTNSSIASGVIHSVIGLINEVTLKMKEFEDCDHLQIFITGGMAMQVRDLLKMDFNFDEFLVLRGIKSVYELNKN